MAMETAKKAIDALSEAMDWFSEIINESVPWQTFEDTLNELEKFRDEYSQKAAEKVAEVKMHMSQGVIAYYQASKAVYEWCLVVEPLLQKYIELFDHIDKTKSAEQKKVLVSMLDNGIAEMKKAQEMLGDSSASFNGAAGQLTTLRHQLSSDFSEKSGFYAAKIAQTRAEGYGISAAFGPIAWAIAAGVVEGELVPNIKARFKEARQFYKNLNDIVSNSFTEIDQTKAKLGREIRAIGDLKVKTEEMNTFASIDGVTQLRDTIISSAKGLIDKCTTYRSKHQMFATVYRELNLGENQFSFTISDYDY